MSYPVIGTVDRPVSFTMENGSPDQRVEPITLALVKQHLRFAPTTEDELLNAWIAAARTHFEEQTSRQSVDAVYEYALDRFPISRRIELPRPPLVSVASVVYDDSTGTETTLDPATYRVLPSVLLEGSPATGVMDPYCHCGFLELVYGASWPTALDQARAVRIRRTCGYGTTVAEMPPFMKALLYLLVGHFHRNRSEVTSGGTLQQLPLGAQMLIAAFKYSALPVDPPLGPLCL